MNNAAEMKKNYKIVSSVRHGDGSAVPDTHVFDSEVDARAFVKTSFVDWMGEFGIEMSEKDLAEEVDSIWESYGVIATFRGDDEALSVLNIWVDDGTELPEDIRTSLDFDFREGSQPGPEDVDLVEEEA